MYENILVNVNPGDVPLDGDKSPLLRPMDNPVALAQGADTAFNLFSQAIMAAFEQLLAADTKWDFSPFYKISDEALSEEYFCEAMKAAWQHNLQMYQSKPDSRRGFDIYFDTQKILHAIDRRLVAHFNVVFYILENKAREIKGYRKLNLQRYATEMHFTYFPDPKGYRLISAFDSFEQITGNEVQ